MVQICEGTKTKAEMLAENVEKYKDTYMRTRQEFNRILTVSVFTCYDIYIYMLIICVVIERWEPSR